MEYLQEIKLWNGPAPFAEDGDAVKKECFTPDKGDGIKRITDVTDPSITFYPASGKGPKPAVLVCPGGAYSILAWNHEGRDICALLNLNGFSAFLLKYRCPGRRAAAHADAARAMRLIRANAAEFGIIPDKVGIIGFSAGGHLSATMCAPADPVPYPAQDAADEFSYRPNFAALIYPAYLVSEETWEINPEFNITPETPPTFIVQAENDMVPVENTLIWYRALKNAGVPAEMHLYDDGGHGYSLLRTGNPISNWGTLAGDWFRRQADLP